MAKKINVKVESVEVNEENVKNVAEEVNTEDTKKNESTTDSQIELKVRVTVKNPQRSCDDVCDYIVKAWNECDAVYKMSIDYLMKKGLKCDYIQWDFRPETKNLEAKCYCQEGIVVSFFVPAENKTERWDFSKESLIKDNILSKEVRSTSSNLARFNKIRSDITVEFMQLPIEEATQEKAIQLKFQKLLELVDGDFYYDPLPNINYYQLFSYATAENKNNLPINPNRNNGSIFIIDEGKDKYEGRYFTAACINKMRIAVVKVYKSGKIEDLGFENISNYIRVLYDKFVNEYSKKKYGSRKNPYEISGIGEIDGLRVIKINTFRNFTWKMFSCSIFENGQYVIEF